MSDLTSYPLQDDYETTLSQSLAASATALTIYVNTAPSFTFPSSTTTYAVINPSKSNMEVVKIESYSSSAKTLTVASGGRAQAQYASHSASVQAHAAGSKILISDSFSFWNDLKTAINDKVDVGGDTMTGLLQWSGTSHAGVKLLSLTTTQRDALTAANGNIIYNSTTGEFNVYQGGAWSAVASGSTQPNASTTVAGKVEEATQAENDAGTAAGASADLFATPAVSAATIQKGAWLYAADAGSTDAYAITLAPAVTAYTTGMVVYFKANTANTAAATLNVNSLGAKTIKKNNDQDLATGDIEASQLCEVIYDGTNFQLLSDSNPITTKGDIIGGTGSGGTSRLAVGTNGQVLSANSSETTGLIWSTLSYNKKITTATTDVAIANSATETTLVSATVTGGSLSTNNCIRAVVRVDTVQSVAATTDLTIRMKYGATTVVTNTISNIGALSLGGGDITAYLYAAASATSQEGSVLADIQTNAINANDGIVGVYNLAKGTAAETSSGDLTFTITAQFDAADASNTLTAIHSVVELITA